MKKQTKHILINILKFTIALLSFAFIFIKIKEYYTQDISFLPNNKYDLFSFIIVFFLMFANWSIEALKWQYLIKDFEKIKFRTSLKAIFVGLTTSIFTPNRVGEIAGRSFVLKKNNRGKGIFATAVGSMSQMIVTIILGVIFGSLFLFFYDEKISNVNYETVLLIKIFSIAILFFSLYFFFNMKFFIKLISKFNLPNKYIETIVVLSSYKKNRLFKVLGYSFLRYVVFFTQFLLLLKMFNVNICFFKASIGIILTFFISSSIPTFTFAEIGIRGSAAIFFIGMYSNNIQGIVSATALLWIVNLAVPSIIGSFMLYKLKL